MMRVDDRAEAGEVTTPVDLAIEMIAKIPEEQFISTTSTFLDPCFGNGTFIIEIIKKLKSYGHSIENIEKRVYGCEISQRLVNKLKKRLAKYQFDNIILGDSLEREWNMNFDVVVANPPYQEGKRRDEANKLWPRFVKFGYKVLKDDGVLSMIHPLGWLNVDTSDIGKGKSGVKLYSDIFQQNWVEFLCVNDTRLKSFFSGVGSTFSYYTLHKTSVIKPTTIEYADGSRENIDLPSTARIPTSLTKIAFSIFEKFTSKDLPKIGFVDQIQGYWVGDDKLSSNDKLKYKLYHTPAKGGTYKYSNKPCPITKTYRIAISLSGKYVPTITEEGVTNMCVTFVTDSKAELDSIYSFLNSKLFSYYVKNNSPSGFLSRPAILNLPRLDTTKTWTDDEIYKFFNLTDEEISAVGTLI